MWRKKPMKCDCGHARTMHADPIRTARVGCSVVGCRCNKSQEDVKRASAPAELPGGEK